MTPKEILKELEAKGDARRRAHNTKFGAGNNQFGVAMGDIRALAKKIKPDHKLALALWNTGNIDAQFLAILALKPAQLSADELDALVRSIDFVHVADWMNSYVVKQHPAKDALRQRWMKDSDPMAARAGWSLTADALANRAKDQDPTKLLKRLEKEMGSAHSHTQWTMNAALAQIGINFPEHRERAIAIAEKLGLYRDYPCSKGCTSPFAPIWIREMVKRQG